MHAAARHRQQLPMGTPSRCPAESSQGAEAWTGSKEGATRASTHPALLQRHRLGSAAGCNAGRAAQSSVGHDRTQQASTALSNKQAAAAQLCTADLQRSCAAHLHSEALRDGVDLALWDGDPGQERLPRALQRAVR